MKEESREDVLLALQEMKRQFLRLRDNYGEELDDPMASFGPSVRLRQTSEDLMAGKITEETAEAEWERLEEELGRMARATDDPSIVSPLDFKNGAKARQLPDAAQLLASDAAKVAAEGLSKEDWIFEVLKGHAQNEQAQLGCLKHILALWETGPWPWPTS